MRFSEPIGVFCLDVKLDNRAIGIRIAGQPLTGTENGMQEQGVIRFLG
jgi:hypothetical protein